MVEEGLGFAVNDLDRWIAGHFEEREAGAQEDRAPLAEKEV